MVPTADGQDGRMVHVAVTPSPESGVRRRKAKKQGELTGKRMGFLATREKVGSPLAVVSLIRVRR